jgi:hypothetical protein
MVETETFGRDPDDDLLGLQLLHHTLTPSLLCREEPRSRDIQKLTSEMSRWSTFGGQTDTGSIDSADEVYLIYYLWPFDMTFPDSDPAEREPDCRKLEDVSL